jgi:hypothetical protein
LGEASENNASGQRDQQKLAWAHIGQPGASQEFLYGAQRSPLLRLPAAGVRQAVIYKVDGYAEHGGSQQRR